MKRSDFPHAEKRSCRVYDISQEVFGCEVYPGDPSPKREMLSSMADGALYNLTAFSMCAHNGTHIDAPFHFLRDGVTIERMPLEKTVGYAYVAVHNGHLEADDARAILSKAAACRAECARRILIKGNAVITLSAAEVFAAAGLDLIGNESQSVGPEEAPMAVHRVLLEAGTALLEGIRLEAVAEGMYWLNAAPLCLGGADGAPCRATLTDIL